MTTKTPAKRVRDSEARKIAAGGRRMPDGILPANAAAALDALLGAGYAASANAVIARALEDAARRARVRP